MPETLSLNDRHLLLLRVGVSRAFVSGEGLREALGAAFRKATSETPLVGAWGCTVQSNRLESTGTFLVDEDGVSFPSPPCAHVEGLHREYPPLFAAIESGSVLFFVQQGGVPMSMPFREALSHDGPVTLVLLPCFRGDRLEGVVVLVLAGETDLEPFRTDFDALGAEIAGGIVHQREFARLRHQQQTRLERDHLEERSKTDESQQRIFSQIFRMADTIPGALFRFTAKGSGHPTVNFLSRNAADLFAIPWSDLEHCLDQIFGVLTEEEGIRLVESLHHSYEAGLAWSFDFRLETADGAPRWIRGNAVPEPGKGNLRHWNGFFIDITEQRQVEERHQDRARGYQKLFSAASDAVIIYDNESLEIVEVNKAATRLYGYSEAEFAELTYFDLIADRVEQEEKSGEWKSLQFIMNQHKKKSGAVFPADSTTGAYRFHGRPLRFLLVRDATVAQKAQEHLEQARQEAENSARAKAEFLANMSHEIRTPLNTILGITQELLEHNDPGQARDLVAMIHRSGGVLLNHINNILDFSKLEADRATLQRIPFHLKGLVEEASALMEQEARGKGLSLTTSLPDEFVATREGDPDRIRQVLINLLANAIKFTNRGGVTLKVVDRGDPWIQFEVIDTGLGIAEEDQRRLFQPFTQIEPARTKRHEGTGLGLAISARLVSAMGGEIGVESEVNEGSRFWFCIPIPETEAVTETATPQTETRAPAVTRMDRPDFGDQSADDWPELLLVEDNPGNQWVATLLLRRMKYRVDIAETGFEAIEKFRRNRYAAVLLDCQLPIMDGYETCTRLREIEGGEGHTPIIALTANAMKGDREKCLETGMDDYLTKPIDREMLNRTLSAWVGVATSPVPPRSGPGQRSEDEVRRRVRELASDLDPDSMHRILGVFRENAVELRSRIRDGAAAGDADEVADALHKLRGSIGSLGAQTISQMCKHAMDTIRERRADNLTDLVHDIDVEAGSIIRTLDAMDHESSGETS